MRPESTGTGPCHGNRTMPREQEPCSARVKGEAMSGYKAVLFDLDGTINDSGPGIMNSVRYAIERMGRKPLPPETLRRFIGPALLYSFKKYAGMTEEESWQAIGYYKECYDGGEAYNLNIYEGIPELLERLGQNGVLCAVVTTKPEAVAEKILERFDMKKHFACVIGPESDGASNQKSILIRRALRKLGLEEQDAVMIGDTRFDAAGASEAGCDFIGVTYGYGTPEELREDRTVFLADSAAQIAPWVLKI